MPLFCNRCGSARDRFCGSAFIQYMGNHQGKSAETITQTKYERCETKKKTKRNLSVPSEESHSCRQPKAEVGGSFVESVPVVFYKPSESAGRLTFLPLKANTSVTFLHRQLETSTQAQKSSRKSGIVITVLKLFEWVLTSKIQGEKQNVLYLNHFNVPKINLHLLRYAKSLFTYFPILNFC